MSARRFDDIGPLDPELLELLRQIAARQEARLSRPDPPQSVRALLQSASVLSTGATGLILAEHELLRQFRGEVAFLLHALAYRLIQETESFRRAFCTPRTSSVLDGASDPSHICARLTQERKRLRAALELDSGLRELLDVIDVGLGPLPTPGTLAHASLLLVPSTEARLCLAAELFRSGSLGAALSAFTSLCELAPLPAHRACAHSWRGVVLARQGALDAAVEAYREAARLNPDEPAHLSNWLAQGVQTGDIREVWDALSAIDGRVSASDPGLHAWLSNAYEQRGLGEWQPTLSATNLSARLMESVDPAARRILRVFL